MKNSSLLVAAITVVLLSSTPSSAQNIFEQIVDGATHLVNEVDHLARDLPPIQVDPQHGQIIVSGPTESWAFSPFDRHHYSDA